MRILEINASILSNTNKIVSSSEDHWSSIKEGSFVHFSDESTFYVVGKINPLFYIKDAAVTERKKLTVNEDVGINLGVGDFLSITYKEYELMTVLGPDLPGSGYKAGDVISLEGGHLSIDKNTGMTQPATFVVTQVNIDGGILQIRLEKRGKYIIAPAEKVAIVGGSGNGATFLVKYKTCDDRSIVDRGIISLERFPGKTVLTLDSFIPEGVQEVKLSVNKWEMLLTSNYAGETKINARYKVTSDFTPYLNIPLLIKNNASAEAIYNHAVTVIDKKLKDLDDRIKAIESKS
jgi:hypothetical protein